ncbi:hypothetical protein SPLC1_S411750 [Arthrospira platensis C1]|nr:hypothetical protein SPLC1_S411750 [Arthrospira platensis C1]
MSIIAGKISPPKLVFWQIYCIIQLGILTLNILT